MLEFTALSDKDLAVTKTNFHATDPAAESSIGVFSSSNRDVKIFFSVVLQRHGAGKVHSCSVTTGEA